MIEHPKEAAETRATLTRDFYERSPLVCARALIGAELSWGDCSGIVVETEAYDAVGDEACHTFFRPSTRAFVERHVPGTAYVYLNYGMHWLLNVLVKGRREGFVLFRAVEPTAGIELMRRRRGLDEIRKLCSGPGKLTQAMGIGGEAHGIDLCEDPAFGFRARRGRPRVVADERIGISVAQHLPWRFTLAGSRFVSLAVRQVGRG
jgi:DNA-3-methyladenine glycosylase